MCCEKSEVRVYLGTDCQEGQVYTNRLSLRHTQGLEIPYLGIHCGTAGVTEHKGRLEVLLSRAVSGSRPERMSLSSRCLDISYHISYEQ
jgi:hypothetical protein